MASIIEHNHIWKLNYRTIQVMAKTGLIYQCPADHGLLDATDDDLPVWHVENESMSFEGIDAMIKEVQKVLKDFNDNVMATNKFKQHDDQWYECMNCGVLRTHDPVAWVGCQDELGRSCKRTSPETIAAIMDDLGG